MAVISIDKATIEEKSVLRNLMELYNYDFTEFDPEDVNEHGLYGYKYFDHYWTDEGRYPFLVRVDGKYAGFALVRVIEFGYDIYTFSMAEFFVMKKYRKTGVGKYIAMELFNKFKGKWKVAVIEENKPAQLFWRKVVQEYTGGKFEEVREEGWSGPIEAFVSE